MGGQYGVKQLKKLLDLGFAVGDVAKLALADGKVDLTDLTLLLGIIPTIGPAVEGIGLAPKEFAELDAADGAELLAYGKSKLRGVPDDQLKDIVGAALLLGLGAGRLLSALKKVSPQVSP